MGWNPFAQFTNNVQVLLDALWERNKLQEAPGMGGFALGCWFNTDHPTVGPSRLAIT